MECFQYQEAKYSFLKLDLVGEYNGFSIGLTVFKYFKRVRLEFFVSRSLHSTKVQHHSITLRFKHKSPYVAG